MRRFARALTIYFSIGLTMLHCPRNIMRILAYSGLFLTTGFARALAADPTGDWRVADGVADIRVADCNGSMWGVVVWEKEPGGRDKGGRDKGGRDKGGRDKRDSGPSHRQYATSAAPRERDRPIDPNSPFAKLAALKEQLAGRKE